MTTPPHPHNTFIERKVEELDELLTPAGFNMIEEAREKVRAILLEAIEHGREEAIDYAIAHSFVDKTFAHMRLINEKVLEAARKSL